MLRIYSIGCDCYHLEGKTICSITPHHVFFWRCLHLWRAGWNVRCSLAFETVTSHHKFLTLGTFHLWTVMFTVLLSWRQALSFAAHSPFFPLFSKFLSRTFSLHLPFDLFSCHGCFYIFLISLMLSCSCLLDGTKDIACFVQRHYQTVILAPYCQTKALQDLLHWSWGMRFLILLMF